jgi:phosphoribosylamine--glycine ligase
MHVLLIGAGGREHALAAALARSPRLSRLSIAPGNPGMAALGDLVALDPADHGAVIAHCKAEKVDLVVIGPEAPLVAGLVDDLEAAGIAAFGPTKAAARLEGSKGFTKDLCARFNIPTAAYARFTDRAAAEDYVRRQGAPIVIKADGLAAGKGVTVAMTLDEALAAVADCFAGVFGAAGAEVVVEAYLEGEEASFFALSDGETALAFASAQDHKRVGDGDTGPNTGGMGAYSPAPVMDAAMTARVMDEIVAPTLRGMAALGCPFKGVLFAGLMLTAEGPQLIEYNVRFGDPETQAMLPRLTSDLIDLMLASRAGTLVGKTVGFDPRPALTVVVAAKGYPAAPKAGGGIAGIERAEAVEGVTVLHAGTALVDGRLVAKGGRVLGVTAVADTLSQAQARAYQAVDALDFPDGFCRRDIGWRALRR